MKKCIMVGLCVLFSFMFCFNCLGYAALSAELTVEGEATWTMPEGVFILKTENETNMTGVIPNATALSANMTANSGSVKITFYNNSEYDYIFDGVVFTEEGGYNTGLTVVTDKDKLNDKVAAEKEQKIIHKGEELVIEATYSGSANLKTMVNYQFVLTAEYVDKAAVDAALERFTQILNDETLANGLCNELDDGLSLIDPDNVLTGILGWLLDVDEYDYPIVSNVGESVLSSDNSDVQYVESLFTTTDENGKQTNHLTLKGEGNDTVNVTALIQGVDSNGDGAYDIMMLYLTPIDIQGQDKTVTPVYVAFFQYNTTLERWNQVGDLHKGSSGACRYSTAKDQSSNTWNRYNLGNNSFDPDTWVSDAGVTRNALLEQVKAGTLN